ncbi:hypothetical protein WJM97_19555 [Okeanomitos corallinicola TIOX110]|uniref:Uncharacterized protein n=1 Tax=Okeanomitos corallinicola TIOX110 TaxID=3133117 RepID=A0ABZ2URB7_9CYAN
MQKTFKSWHDLFLNLKANEYQVSAAWENSIIDPENDTLPPIKIINIAENNAFISYLGEVELQALSKQFNLDLDIIQNNPEFASYQVSNPHIHIQGFTTSSIDYQVIVNNINSEDIINLLSQLGGVNLPEPLQLKLNSLDQVNLGLATSEIYLYFNDDIQLNLNDFFNLSSNLQLPSINIEEIFNSFITKIFGTSKLIISEAKLRLSPEDISNKLSLTGLINDQEVELTFSDRITLQYQLSDDIDFSSLTSDLPVIKDLKLRNGELIITDNTYLCNHTKLGRININKGFNFIGDINLTSLNTDFSGFINSQLAIDDLGVLISFDPGGLVSLTGDIKQNTPLISVQDFHANFTNLLFSIDIGANLEPSFELIGNLAIQGYDLTQDDEPTLFLTGAVALEPKSLTAFFSQQGENSWCNPYGLVGTELRNICFQGGGTYLPPYFDNFGFIGDLKWDSIDIEIAFLMDTNDPHKLALILTTNQAVSLVKLWQGPLAGFVCKQVNFSTDLVDQTLEFLNTFLDLSIESIDREGDGKYEPLIKIVPFATEIAGQPISAGLEINGKVTAWNHEATLILQSDQAFQKIEGSLNVPEIDLGVVKVGGTDDDCLDLALKVTPTEQYLSGDGQVEIFDQEIAKVEFQITPTNAIFKDFDLSFANLISIDVDNLSIDIKSGIGNGSGKILVLGNTIAGSTFYLTKNGITIHNTTLNLAGFLTLDIESLTINLANNQATGTADITAFEQSLGTGTLSFNHQAITINNASWNLANILKIDVPSFSLDLTNKTVFGLGDVSILGRKFSAVDISLTESGFQSSGDFNFGILAFHSATLILGKGKNGNINNSASIAGHVKFLGYDFFNVKASADSSKLILSSSFNFGGIILLKGSKKRKNAIITLKKDKNGRYHTVISGRFYLFNQELTAINIKDLQKQKKVKTT